MKKWLFIFVGVVLVGLGGAWLWPHPSDDRSSSNDESGHATSKPLPDFDPVKVSSDVPSGLSLTGIVKDSAGQPVPDAEVSLAASAQASLASVRCEECGQALLSCPSRETWTRMRDLLDSGRGQVHAGLTTRTGDDGHFRFDNLSGVSFTVWASAPGFGSAIHERAAPGDPVELFLPALRSIVGTVTDEQGRPVSNAKVHGISRRLPIPADATTNGSGVFELRGLGEGPFYVLAEADGFLPFALPSVEAGPTPARIQLIRPRVLEVQVRRNGEPVDATVQLTADHLARTANASKGFAHIGELFPDDVWVTATTGALSAPPQKITLMEPVTRVQLDLDTAGRVMVTVVDEAGQPVVDPELMLSRTADGEPFAKRKAHTGDLVAFGPLAVGQYVLTAIATGYKPVQMPVKVTAAESNVDVVMSKGTFIRGRVLDEYGRPAPHISVLVEPTGNVVNADDDGRFTADVPSPGLYELEAHHSDWGGGEAKVTAPADGIELHLEPKAGLRVTVTSAGRRLEGADVNLWREGDAVFRNDRPSGSDGVVLMRGLPGGTYWLVAGHRDFLPSERRQVELKDGELEDVEVSLEAGSKIAGQVVDEKGEPVSGATVSAIPRGAEPAVTDADGQFEIRPLRPDRTYRLEALHPSYDQDERVPATPGEAPVKITLRKRATFRGRVLDDKGAPITSFRVDSQDVVNAEGRFELPLAADDGRVFAVVEATGFQPHMVDAPTDRPDVGDVVLAREPQAEGLVRDENGGPIDGAVVTCDVCDSQMTTGTDGRFSLSVPPHIASYVVTATKGSMTGTTTAGGTKTPIEVVLRQAVHLTGHAYQPGGAPASGVEIEAVHIDRAEPFTVVTMQDGSFSADLPEGNYRFTMPNQESPLAGDPVIFAYVHGDQMSIDLGQVPGSSGLTVHLTPKPGFALWVVRGPVASVGNPPMDLFKSAWAQMIYQPQSESVTVDGLVPGLYTLVWSRFHAQTDSGPVLRPVDIPGTREVALP